MLIWRSCLRGRFWARCLVVCALARPAWAAGDVGAELLAEKRAELGRRSGRPEAIAEVASLVQNQDDLPPGGLAQLLSDLLDGRLGGQLDPLVRAQVAYLLSLEEDRGGRFAEADAHRRALGFLADAWVLGPFDSQGRSGFQRVFPVEEEGGAIDPRAGKSYPGKERTIAWRRADPAAFVEGALFLDALVRPGTEAAAFCLAYVHSEREQWAVLRAGASGPLAAWLGGRQVLASDVVRPAWPDQEAAVVRLRKGANLLLLKTVAVRGPWRLFARLTDVRGLPLPGVSFGTEAPGQLAAAGSRPTRAPEARELGTLLRRRAEAAVPSAAAQAWLDYALYLALATPADNEARAVELATKRAVPPFGSPRSAPSVEALLLLGDVAREEDDRRAALERALPLLPSASRRAHALAAEGSLWRAQNREDQAVATWRAAVALDPACVPAQLALAREEQRAAMAGAALARLAALPESARRLPVVLDAYAEVESALGRKQAAEAKRRLLLASRRTDVGLLRELASAARTRGDLGEAARLFAEAARWRPDLAHLAVEQAELLEAAGDVAAARAVLGQASRRLLGDAGLLEEMGRLEARAGDAEAALAAMRQALALRPQNPSLRRYMESLAGARTSRPRAGTADALVTESAADGEALAREVLWGPPAKDDASAEVLLDRTAVRVHENGLAERFVQRLVHARTERAARDSRETRVRFEPGRQEVEIRKARILRRSPGGDLEISEASGRDEENTSEPWYGLYYDTRAAVVSFENLRAGDVVEVQYTVVDVGYRNELADYFGDFVLIADLWPVRRWDYTLTAPATRTLHFNRPRCDRLEREQEAVGADLRYRFVAKDVPRVETEPAMPGFAEVAPYLHVSTYATWADVGRWYWNLVAEQMQDDGTLRQAAEQATSGRGTVGDKVRAIHRLVLEKTRYVGLEFGIHGYKPYRATQVFERGFGDCKDKATLLVTLLGSVGVPAELVLLRTRRSGRIDEAPASLAVFDHAIVYVPGLKLYLDGTAEFSGIGELPAEDQDTMALRVSAAGATLVRTPLLPAEDNLASRQWQVDLLADGSARITEDLTIQGQAAHEWRSHYQTAGERRERYAKVWNGRYAGTQLEQVAMEVSDRNRPVKVSATVKVPELGERRGPGELALPTSSREADLAANYARLGERQWPVVLGYPWRHVERVRYRLPAGARLVRAPAGRQIASPFGTFSLEVEHGGNAIGIASELVVRVSRIARADYPAFRAFLRDIDVALAERLVVALGRTP
jgi:transglutaminase-like putative cysteine protease/tetratricopeptide (TPR) repeat protein